MKEKILKIVNQQGAITLSEIAKKLNRNPGDPELKQNVRELAEELEIAEASRGRLKSVESKDYVRGTLDVKKGGFAFVRSEDGDVFIKSTDKGGAFDGETVLVKVIGQRESDKRREGKVVKIAKSGPVRLTGVLARSRRAAFVVCDNRKSGDIFIPRGASMGAEDGQKVVAEITKRGDGKTSPEGKVVEILGFEGAPGVDILSVAKSYGMEERFPKAVMKQAQAAARESLEPELKRRETLFDKVIFTIDGADSKDLDDGVSIEKTSGGRYLLGVHIADVSHYVGEDSPLDKEALKRSTSVYLLDRVIPMLPKELSNGICSLNPGEARLTLSCFMEIDGRGHVISHRIAETAIISRHKMTYGDVNKILEDGDKGLQRKYGDILPQLKMMEELAAILRERRFCRGSVDFEIDEAKIRLDKSGKPIEIGVQDRRVAEKLIEEFMLKCNETVAEEYYYAELPFLYRVHETPDKDKMRELAIFLSNFGYKLKASGELKSGTIKAVLDEFKGREEENIVNSVVLRSMKKARYTQENLGHFGLAAKNYAHFTSPIRRYPDLMIHRIIKENLRGGLSSKRIDHYTRLLPSVGEQTSRCERAAIEAERRVDDIKKAEYMTDFIGEEYEGIVSGVAPSALFVELENTVEGVIPLAELKDDYYAYFKELYCVIGQRTKRRINLGDKVRVQVKAADPKEGRVEFSLLRPNGKLSVRRKPPKKRERPKGKGRRRGRGEKKAREI